MTYDHRASQELSNGLEPDHPGDRANLEIQHPASAAYRPRGNRLTLEVPPVAKLTITIDVSDRIERDRIAGELIAMGAVAQPMRVEPDLEHLVTADTFLLPFDCYPAASRVHLMLWRWDHNPQPIPAADAIARAQEDPSW